MEGSNNMKRSISALILIIAIFTFAANGLAVEVADMDLHGFLSQGYVKSSDNNLFANTTNGTTQFNEFGINFAKDITDKLHAGAQLFAKDYGQTGNNHLEIDWAYADYRFKDWLGVRAGKVKIPHGLYNQTRDVDMLRTSIFLPQSIYPEVLRDTMLSTVGVSLYGDVNVSFLGQFSYQAIVGKHNQAIEPSERTNQAFLNTQSSNNVAKTDDININKRYAASVVWEPPVDGLRLSTTYGNSKINITNEVIASDFFMPLGSKFSIAFKKFQYHVYSAEYVWNNLTLSTEYMQTKRSFNMGMGDMNLSSKGWYLNASHRFTDWFVLGSYYATTRSYEANAGGPGGGPGVAAGRNYLKDMCLTTRFDINQHLVFKLEGHKFKGTNMLSALDADADSQGNIAWPENWNMFAGKLTFSF
jgi:hypothetical protein